MAAKKSSFGTDSEGETTYTGEQSSSLTTSTTFDTTCSRLNATRIELERRQLTHSIQLLKLELSQKDMIVEALKTEHSNNVDELEERLADITCERNLLHQKLRAMTNVYEEELKDLRKQNNEAKICSCQIERPRTDADPRSHTLPHSDTKTESLIVEELKIALRKPLLSDEEFETMYNVNELEMSIAELARVRVYEASMPFIKENEVLSKETKQLKICLSQIEKKHDQLMKDLKESNVEIVQLRTQCEELSHFNETLSTKAKYNTYKTCNFDIVKKERDDLQREMDAVRRALVGKEITEKVKEEERGKLQEELSLAQQSVTLLKQDKEYLSKQVIETSSRCREVEEKNTLLHEQLTSTKQSKEELYEQFIRTRQQQKDEYGQQLTEELDGIRRKTSLEIEQVRIQTREMFERENRVLQESKERSDNDRDRIGGKLTQMEEKYELLMTEFRQLQLSSEGQISDLQSELHMKVFECERATLFQEEANKSLTVTQRERNKYIDKIESLKEDLRRLTIDRDTKLREYESSLKEKSQRLETYESLEHELDDVVMQAAEMENEQDAERVLFSFGFGTSIPSTSRRRMQQSVQLARRVLKLERINVSLRQQLESMDKEKEKLKEKMSGMCTRLDLSQQPQKYLLETLQTRDNEMINVKNRNSALEARIRELEKERKTLIETKNHLSLDLERLLNQNEELNIMKRMVTALSKKEGKRGACPTLVTMDIENTPLQPQPMIFTRQDPPSWYKTTTDVKRTTS